MGLSDWSACNCEPPCAPQQSSTGLIALLPDSGAVSRKIVKRLFDIIVSASLLVVLSAPLGVLALLVRAKLGSPVIFRQLRPGMGTRPFEMLKFRTMTNACGEDGQLLADCERLTRFGLALRESSLDELPGLINVLKGDMSIVGPRPLLMQYVPLYDARQIRRHDIRPGITGWAQVNGRNALSWEEKFELDVWYIDNHNWRLDLKILWLTLVKVIRRDGISAAGEATMPPFTGNQAKR